MVAQSSTNGGHHGSPEGKVKGKFLDIHTVSKINIKTNTYAIIYFINNQACIHENKHTKCLLTWQFEKTLYREHFHASSRQMADVETEGILCKEWHV